MSMKSLSTMFVALALACAGACAHDEDDDRRARTDSSGSEHASRQRADADHDDVDDDTDESVDESARVNANAAPIAPAQTQDSTRASSSGDVPTAQDQSVGTSDEDITRTIRQALVGDDSLSMAARNVTIVTRSGVVTLRGSLSEGDERSAIERHARAANGVVRVDNRISVRD